MPQVKEDGKKKKKKKDNCVYMHSCYLSVF